MPVPVYKEKLTIMQPLWELRQNRNYGGFINRHEICTVPVSQEGGREEGGDGKGEREREKHGNKPNTTMQKQ